MRRATISGTVFLAFLVLASCKSQSSIGAEEDAPVGRSPAADLITAAKTGNLPRVKKLLSGKPELANKPNGVSALRAAASSGQYEVCRYLLEEHAVDVNDFERFDGLPIIVNAVPHPDVVQLLMEHGADLKTRISFKGILAGMLLIQDDATVLHYAARRGAPKTITLLIDHGVDIFAVTQWKDQTALDVAATFGNADTAEAIVNHPLFDSADAQLRQALLDRCLWRGAIPDDGNRGGDRFRLTEVLLVKGANPNAIRNRVTTLQNIASDFYPGEVDRQAECKRMVALLVKGGAKMDLYSAVALGDEAQVHAILAAVPRQANMRGPCERISTLHNAVRMNHPSIVAELLKAGADVNILDENTETGSKGWSPLDWADSWKRQEIAKLLVQAGGKRSKELASDK